MRPATALLLALLCSATLAGCANKAGLPEPAPSTAGLPIWQERVQLNETVSTTPGCTQMACTSGGFPFQLYVVPDNASLTALHLEFAKPRGLDNPVSWEIWCESSRNDSACLHPFASGRDPLPLVLDLDAPAPPTARVVASLVAPPMTPVPMADYFASRSWGPITVKATATLAANTTFVHPLRIPVNVSFDGHTAPCLPAEPVCDGYPSGTNFDLVNLGGTLAAVNLTMTWTSMSPLDAQLHLDLWAYCGSDTCPNSVQAEGPSPLHLDADRLWMRHGGQLNPRALYTAGDLVGTRTPVHVEGVVWIEPELDSETSQ